MATNVQRVLACALMLGTCGCFAPQGYLFTNTTVPYAVPGETSVRVGTKSCHVNITQIKEPFSRLNLSVMWSDRAVAEAMSKAGMTDLHYADVQTLSVMNKVYERRRLVFYGE